MFNQTKNHKQYTIKLVTPSGNTVGFVNLSSTFLKAIVGKQEETITASDIEAINDDNFAKYIKTLTIRVEEVEPTTKTSIKDF